MILTNGRRILLCAASVDLIYSCLREYQASNEVIAIAMVLMTHYYLDHFPSVSTNGACHVTVYFFAWLIWIDIQSTFTSRLGFPVHFTQMMAAIIVHLPEK